jgi:hypothetical protein
MKLAWFFVWSFRIVFFTVLLTPLIMFLVWLFKPGQPKGITIIDKTVLDQRFEEHESMFWYLNYHKWQHPITGKRYKAAENYFGFFPKSDEKYEVRGLEGRTKGALDSIAAHSAYLYITDSYGIYHNEWYKDGDEKERSAHLYGGLAQEDLYLLQQMDQAGKTIITEFNTIANPTKGAIRAKFEAQFGLKWSGWIGRNFESLDTLKNKELPRWLIQNYLKQYGKWPFKRSGIVFVNESDRIEILEKGADLKESVPHIYTRKNFVDSSGVDASLYYPFWFDIMEIGPEIEALAYYHLPTTPRGDSLLQKFGIPYFFPAVMRRKETKEKAAFYYFAGDFCDNPITMKRSYFRGITYFSEFYYDQTDNTDRQTFFWRYYLPLLDEILAN